MQRAGAAFVRLQTPADFEGTPRVKASIYLLAAVMPLAASCGDSNNTGPELLFVQTSDGATLTDSTLTLRGISPNTGWFTVRPYREAGQIPTEEFLTLWDEGENSFADDPPNADFTCTVDGEVRCDGAEHLFIDDDESSACDIQGQGSFGQSLCEIYQEKFGEPF